MLMPKWTSLKNCLVQVRSCFTSLQRSGSSWTQRTDRREELKKIVFQHAGENVQRADRLYAWGCAATGALGRKTLLKPEKNKRPRLRQLTPHRLDFFHDIKLKVRNVECGYGFTVYVCEKESKRSVLYGTGINTSSQLGFQEFPRKSGRILDCLVEPVYIALPLLHHESTKLTHVACGRAHTVVATDKEGIFALGDNSYGQCARPVVKDEEYRGSQMISRFNVEGQVKQVVCGQDHTLLLTTEGKVYSCGLSQYGQTGLGTYDPVCDLSLVRGDIEGERITHISCKADSVLAVSDEGKLFGWGNAEHGQLGEIDNMEINSPQLINFRDVGKIVKTAIGYSMAALLNEHGQVYTWGRGILGKGPKLEHSVTPELIPQTLFGSSDFDPMRKVRDIHCGPHFFTAVNETGDLFVWGRNTEACLGLGNRLDQYFPFKVQVPAETVKVACGADHMVVQCKSFF